MPGLPLRFYPLISQTWTWAKTLVRSCKLTRPIADKQIAQAKAEERRAMAVALEQEMRARVIEAEAEVPRAMAEAFRKGNIGIMDYYRMKNVQADTAMREAIGHDGEESEAR